MEIVKELLAAAADPMWADHAEIPKTVLRRAAEEIEQLRKDVGFLEGLVAEMGEGPGN